MTGQGSLWYLSSAFNSGVLTYFFGVTDIVSLDCLVKEKKREYPGSVEIPVLPLVLAFHTESILPIYHKGGCRSGGGNVNRRCPDGHLLQFAFPSGNGKRPQER